MLILERAMLGFKYLLFTISCVIAYFNPFLCSKRLFCDHAHLVHSNLSLSILLMFIVYCISIGAAGGTLSGVRWVWGARKANLVVQWNLSKTATSGPILTDLYREVAVL